LEQTNVMESGQITSIILASLICGTITIGVLAQAWAARRSSTPAKGGSVANRLDSLEDRLYRLEQAIDTVAVELERGTEAQRYTAKLLAERLDALPAAPPQVRNGER
jgi:hypothetical protein